jgi:ferredoxin
VRIEVDRDRCCGGGLCTLSAPTVFEQGEEDGIVVLLKSKPDEVEHSAVLAAAGLCPTGSIRIVAD